MTGASNQGAATVADAFSGAKLQLDSYLKAPVTVVSAEIAMAGRVLLVESTGGTTYRLRAPDDDDDRLVLEKRAADGGWQSFKRVSAELVTDGGDD